MQKADIKVYVDKHGVGNSKKCHFFTDVLNVQRIVLKLEIISPLSYLEDFVGGIFETR